MTKPESTNPAAETARGGLFLVKPNTPSQAVPAAEPSLSRNPRSMGLFALAGGALATSLLWFLHGILVTMQAK